MKSTSPALAYSKCKQMTSLELFLAAEFREGGLWRARPVAANLAKTLETLESGEWRQLVARLGTLRRHTTKSKERDVARYLQSDKFPGLGPKQSRNYLQALGLSRYETPIDSRVLKTLKRLGCAFVPNAGALADETVYVFIEEALQNIAAQLGIYPCLLDACIFASFDRPGGS